MGETVSVWLVNAVLAGLALLALAAAAFVVLVTVSVWRDRI